MSQLVHPILSGSDCRLGLRAVVLFISFQSCVAGSLASVPVTNRMGSEPPIRIGIRVNVKQARITANGGLLITKGLSGRTVRANREVLVQSMADGIEMSGGHVDTGPERTVFAPAGRGEFVSVDGVSYRGTVEIIPVAGGFNVINVADIEDYLLSVVGSELWSRSAADLPALKAQAVAARTYALRNAGRYRSEGFDVRADVSDQAYRGVRSENGTAARAVQATRGQVIVFGGELITAFYHSTCGRVTASTEEAFRTVRPQPYLQPVSDARPGRGYYGDLSPHFSWTVDWTASELNDRLKETLPSVLGIDPALVTNVQDISVHRTGPSGRVTELRIKVASGEIPVFGPDIRAVLRTPEGDPLRSTDFSLSVDHREGFVWGVRASGSGLGHGVGLCQWGAVGRARSGQDYQTILQTYYQGASVERWY